jgi:hypothetical protein
MKQRKTKNAGFPPPRLQKDPIRAAADYGIDIPMLTANVNRTPAERIRRHQIALETFWALRKAKLVKSIGEIRKTRCSRPTFVK